MNAVERIGQDIRTAGVMKMFEEGMETAHRPGKEDNRTWFSLGVFQKYSVLTATYGEVERKVADIIGIAPLLTSDFWSELSREQNPEILFSMRRHLFFAQNELPKILALLQQDHTTVMKGDDASRPREYREKEMITFVLPEDEKVFSSPARLIAALDSIVSMYSVFAALENHPESDLILLALDSGSDKSFDLLGLAKVMEEVRKLIIAIWDRRVFYRHAQVSQCIALIAESLPVLERIEELKQKKVIGPEQAELLKRKAIHGATQFLESGVVIDAMNAESTQSARLLLRPEQRLLAGPVTSVSAAESPITSVEERLNIGTDSLTSLSSDEIAQLQRLLQKAQDSQTDISKTESKPVKRPRRKDA